MPVKSVPVIHQDGKFATLAEIEAGAIEIALKAYKSRGEAARALGMGRSTLYRKIEEHGLDEVAYDPVYADYIAPPPPPPTPKKPTPRPFARKEPEPLRKAVGCDRRWQPEIRLTA
jgi:hypothetical protein